VDRPQIYRVSSIGIVALPLIAVLDVLLLGYTRPPLPDEGAGAHIFQLCIAAMVPMGLVFLATADWRQRTRIARRFALSAALLVLAFAALYFLENYFYPAH